MLSPRMDLDFLRKYKKRSETQVQLKKRRWKNSLVKRCNAK